VKFFGLATEGTENAEIIEFNHEGHEEHEEKLATEDTEITEFLAGLVYLTKSSFKASFIADFSHRPQVITMTFCKASIIL